VVDLNKKSSQQAVQLGKCDRWFTSNTALWWRIAQQVAQKHLRQVYLMDGNKPGAMISPDPLRAAMWVDTAGAGTRTYGVKAVSESGIPSVLVVSNPVVV
jgi:hypothetical protein